MGVLVQQMITGDLSFIAFSSNPISRDANEVCSKFCGKVCGTLAAFGGELSVSAFSSNLISLDLNEVCSKVCSKVAV